MKEFLKFIFALIIISTISLSIAYCTQETINNKYNKNEKNN